jgi:arginine deiminase
MEKGAVAIDVTSEIEPLKAVVIHRPGSEIGRMTQHELDLLLFDDILSPGETVREHDVMGEILRGAGARVFELQTLLEEAICRATRADTETLLERVCVLSGLSQVVDEVLDWSPEKLAKALVAGVYWDELGRCKTTLDRIRADLSDSHSMALRPVPNLMFMRDPCIAIGDRIIVGRMATAARAREPLLVSFALRHSGRIDRPQFLFEEAAAGQPRAAGSLEGGDVVALSAELALIGCSERTSAQAIERVVHEELFPGFAQLSRVYVAMMPELRSVMHLDTILTQIDRALFLGHEPLVAQGRMGRKSRLVAIVRMERGQPPVLVQGASLLDVLREELGQQVVLIPCGGSNPLHQEREQWTDGANAFCLAPGRIILYSRNVYTIAELAKHGFGEVRLHAAQSREERQALIGEGMRSERTVLSFSGSELSRARGGGRCLTMPLRRRPAPLPRSGEPSNER